MLSNYLYLATPTFGGWVTFAAHLMWQTGARTAKPIFKVGKNFESKTRDFGYGVAYQNIGRETLSALDGLTVLAIDKGHHALLDDLSRARATVVIHDPTELKDAVVPHLKNWKIITIRRAVQAYLQEKFGVESTFKFHPFYPYERVTNGARAGAVAISRVDFDKHTEMIIEANKAGAGVQIYGAINRLYVHHKIGFENFEPYYKGTFSKAFNAVSGILAGAQFMVDMSAIKHDGGGTQYTFLEAIYNGCVLVLNRKWLHNGGDFVEGENCLAAETGAELAEVLRTAGSKHDLQKIASNADKLLVRHVGENWKSLT